MTDRWVVILTPAARRDVGRLDRQGKRRIEQARIASLPRQRTAAPP